MIYTFTYYRHDKKITDTKSYDVNTMREAVNQCILHAKKDNVKISSISCTINGSQGVQRFCDTCQGNEATYGYKDNKMKCKECRK